MLPRLQRVRHLGCGPVAILGAMSTATLPRATELEAAAAEVAEADAAAKAARDHRDDMVRASLDEGASIGAVARVIGVQHTMVSRIRDRQRSSADLR